MVGNGNDQLSVGHHPVIKFLDSLRPQSVSAVESGHEFDAGAFGRPIGAPGRRAGTGMHDVDAVFLNDFFQLQRIEVKLDRIFGFQRQRNMGHFDFFQIVHHASAGGSDEVFDAVLPEGVGDLHRPDFHPAVVKFRQHLQNNRFLFFTFRHFLNIILHSSV